MKPAAIVRNERLCLNNRYRNMDCQRCHQICPQGCNEPAQGLDLTRCDECGMCLAVCPAEAIAGAGYSPESVDEILSSADSRLYLTCTRQDKQSDWPCLGFLEGRLLLAFVYSGKNSNRQVVMDNRHCFDCRPKVARYLQQLCNSLESVLKVTGKHPVIQGQMAAEYKGNDKVIPRRDLVKYLFGEAKKVVAEAVKKDEYLVPLPRRKYFANYAEPASFSGMAPTKLFHGISISDNCHACSLCSKICPNQAITVEDHGRMLDFYHHAFACTGCGVCAANCPREAITLGAAKSLELTHIATRTLLKCKKCGRMHLAVGNSELCFECLYGSRQPFGV